MIMQAQRSRPIRSAGTIYPLDLIRNRFRRPSQAAISADIEAVDRGEVRRVACLFRGTYGSYPRRFKQRMVDLTPDVMAIGPFWYALRRERLRIEERILSAQVRPRDPRSDWNVRAAGIYAPGSGLDWAGFEVIRCQSELGVIELAVPRPDVPLLLHYLDRRTTADGA